MLTALQMGLPGTQELMIVIMIFFMLAIPVAVVAILVLLVVRWRSGDDEQEERIEELEQEVQRLRERQGDEANAGEDSGTPTSGSSEN